MVNNNIYGGTFCSPDERQISTLGTSYTANQLSGAGMKRAGATITNKRVYFSGSVYSLNAKGRFISSIKRKVINVRDITGTGYDFYRPLYYILWGIISFVLSLVMMIYMLEERSEEVAFSVVILGIIMLMIFIITYFVKRKTLLLVEYAGGNIAFDVRWIQRQEQEDFIRNIHLVKDNLYHTAAKDQGFINNSIAYDDVPEL